MKNKIFKIICFLFVFLLISCQSSNLSISYSYIDPSEIEQTSSYNINLVKNDYITVSINETTVLKGEFVNLEIINIEPGYSFTGWYVNDMYKGEDTRLFIQVFEDLKIETKYIIIIVNL